MPVPTLGYGPTEHLANNLSALDHRGWTIPLEELPAPIDTVVEDGVVHDRGCSLTTPSAADLVPANLSAPAGPAHLRSCQQCRASTLTQFATMAAEVNRLVSSLERRTWLRERPNADGSLIPRDRLRERMTTWRLQRFLHGLPLSSLQIGRAHV